MYRSILYYIYIFLLISVKRWRNQQKINNIVLTARNLNRKIRILSCLFEFLKQESKKRSYQYKDRYDCGNY